MKVISMIERKVKGFPMLTNDKLYEVLKTEHSTNKTLVYITDDAGRKHWMPIGKNFIVAQKADLLANKGG